VRVAVVGAGGHGRAAHLPALRALRESHGVELVAIIDRDIDRARAAARDFDFDFASDGLHDALRATAPDACMLLVPSAVTPETAIAVSRYGIPLLLEKPLADSVGAAERMIEELGTAADRTMVSANRRFDPAFTAARDWFEGPIESVVAVMSRSQRPETDFVFQTGIHLVDTIAALAADAPFSVRSVESPDGACWTTASLVAESGLSATVTIAPRAGTIIEELTLLGHEEGARVRFGAMPAPGFTGWRAGGVAESVDTSDADPWVRDGTLAETEAFLQFVASGGPSPVGVRPFLESMRVTSLLAEG
jgi:predicted dehydrogenase